MKPLLFILLAIAVLFFANPSANKHKEHAYVRYQNIALEQGNVNTSIDPAVMTSAVASQVIVKDYYLFSLSYTVLFAESDSPSQQLIGLGLLGKVFDVSGLTSLQGS